MVSFVSNAPNSYLVRFSAFLGGLEMLAKSIEARLGKTYRGSLYYGKIRIWQRFNGWSGSVGEMLAKSAGSGYAARVSETAVLLPLMP